MSSTVKTGTANGTYTASNAASTAYYNAAKTKAYVSNPSPVREFFVRTNLPAGLAGREVISATLRVALAAPPGSSITTKLGRHAYPSAGGYLNTTHANRPGLLSGATEHSITNAFQFRDFDVKDDLQDIAAGGGYYGWRFTVAGTGYYPVWGWGSAYAPTLTVVIGDKISNPVNVRPHGIVSLAKPFITWDGPTGITSVRVQIDVEDGTFASPIFDSGNVASVVAQLNLATTLYAGLANNATVDVRVMHTTTDNGPSGWSTPVTITRKTLSGFTFTGPTSPTNDPTPAVTWTAPGQVNFQITTLVDGKTVADTLITPGTDTAYTPPKGATRAGQIITFRGRAWDSNDRVSSPGDLGYSEATLNLTYQPGATAAITTLTATQPDGIAPWTDLAWTRTPGLADKWIIARNGDILATIDGTVDGSPIWSWRDWTCPPNTDVVYTVQAMNGGVSSAIGPQRAFRNKVTGCWVFDPVNGYYFRFGGQDLQLAFAEQSAWYEPIGAPAAVKRTFSLRGLEGTIGGIMTDYAGRTVEEYEADLYAIKGAPSTSYRVAFGDVNIPAVLDQINSVISTDATTRKIRKVVSIGLRQNGELPFPVVTP